MFAKALVILASISAAFAYPQITNPTSASEIPAGRPFTITWNDNGNTSRPTSASFGMATISLYTGNQIQQTFLRPISLGLNVSNTTSVPFTPDPTAGPNGGPYFIRMDSLSLRDGNAPAMVFSAMFNLSGMTGTFNETVSRQINAGLSTVAPSATNTPTSKLATSITSTATKGSSAAPSATGATSGAESIVFHGSWIGFLLSMFMGVML